MVNGKETFPLVPVAVGLYSTAFNIFNTAILFPFIGVFDRVLSQGRPGRLGRLRGLLARRAISIRTMLKDLPQALSAIQRETARYLEAAGLFLMIARGMPNAPADAEEHFATIDVLSREIRHLHRRHVRSEHAAFRRPTWSPA